MASARKSSASSTTRSARARIALLKYKDGEKAYILAPEGLKVGATVISGPDAAPELGNALPLKAIRSARASTTSN